MNAPLLAARGVDVVLGGRHILHHVDLTLPPGHLLALVGPNGSGKSTLLRVLAGLLVPQRGEVTPPLSNPRQRARRIAYVPQQAGETPPFSVGQAVALGRAPWQNMFGATSAQDAALAEDAMRRMDVLELRHQPLDGCSGGEQQRALLARALCQDADILLLDEPTSAQDYGQQLRIMEALSQWLAARKGGIIMVLHDLNLAALFAHSAVLLHRGRVHAAGTPDQLFRRHILEPVYQCNLLVDEHPCGTTPRITLSR